VKRGSVFVPASTAAGISNSLPRVWECEWRATHCEIETILTEAPERAAGNLDAITAAELKEALAGAVTRRRISVFYQAGLVLVALFMVLLPVAYLAFVAFVAYCTYWYAVHARVLLTSFSGGFYLLFIKTFRT
jgi:hypothetical protein